MNFIKKINRGNKLRAILIVFVGILSGVVYADSAHAQTMPAAVSNTINSTLESAAKNGNLRNQLVTDHSSDLQNKEKTLSEQFNSSLLILKNIQTRLATKSADLAASGTDATSINIWLATSSADIIDSENLIDTFNSSINATPSERSTNIVLIRKQANNAIAALNTAHDDLQSALNALITIVQQ